MTKKRKQRLQSGYNRLPSIAGENGLTLLHWLISFTEAYKGLPLEPVVVLIASLMLELVIDPVSGIALPVRRLPLMTDICRLRLRLAVGSKEP